MSLGSRIKEVREGKGWSQPELADKIGVQYQHISRWERDVANPSADYLIKIGEVCEISLDWLLTGSGSMYRVEEGVVSRPLSKIELPNKLLSFDYSPIVVITQSSQYADFIFLYAPQYKTIKKARQKLLFSNPVYAILCRNHNSYYIFRREWNMDQINPWDPIKDELEKIGETSKKQITIKLKNIGTELYEKIKDWSVKKEDVEALFAGETIILSEDEKKLITTLREHKISPDTTLKKLGI